MSIFSAWTLTCSKSFDSVLVTPSQCCRSRKAFSKSDFLAQFFTRNCIKHESLPFKSPDSPSWFLCFHASNKQTKTLEQSSNSRFLLDKWRGTLISSAAYENILRRENYSFKWDTPRLLAEILLKIRRK